MSLPAELIDEIVYYLPTDEPQTLRNCSLVAKSWVHRCQKRLFETVSISKSTHSSWANSISPANIELLYHVRSLTYLLDPNGWFCFPAHRVDSLGNYLPSLSNLESLVLSSMDLQSDVSQDVGNFSAFWHTLSSLSLRSCYVSPGGLIAIANCFHNLTDLQLYALIHTEDQEPVPTLSRPLRGRLTVQTFRSQDLPILDRLSDLSPELDELVIGGTPQTGISYGHIVDTYGRNVKHLRLLRGYERKLG